MLMLWCPSDCIALYFIQNELLKNARRLRTTFKMRLIDGIFVLLYQYQHKDMRVLGKYSITY